MNFTAPVRKRVPVPKPVDLSPIKASPPTSPNVPAKSDPNARKRQPFGAVNGIRNNVPAAKAGTKPSIDQLAERHKGRMLAELAGPPKKGKGKENHVTQRVQDWERERERLREMSRLEDLEKETDTEDQAEVEPSKTPVEEQERPNSVDLSDKENECKENTPHTNFAATSLPHIPITSPIRVPCKNHRFCDLSLLADIFCHVFSRPSINTRNRSRNYYARPSR